MYCPMFLGDPPLWGCNAKSENQCGHSKTSPQTENKDLDISLKSYTRETSKRDRQRKRENVCVCMCMCAY